MFGISENDMALAVEENIVLRGHEIVWVGYGILGTDEMLPNQNGKYKIATRLTRDKAQFLRTRAIRDMYRRNYSLSGLSEFEDFEMEEGPSKKTLETVLPLQTQIIDTELKTAAMKRFQALSNELQDRGGKPEDFIKLTLNEWLNRATPAMFQMPWNTGWLSKWKWKTSNVRVETRARIKSVNGAAGLVLMKLWVYP
jgi:hypothetical protein